MMMMSRVMCVLAVVLCCPCGYTMAEPASAEKKHRDGDFILGEFPVITKDDSNREIRWRCEKNSFAFINGKNCTELGFVRETAPSPPDVSQPNDSLQPGDPAAKVETGKPVVISQDGRDSDLPPSVPEGSEAQHQSVKGETATSPSTAESQTQGSTPSTKGDAAPQGDQGTPSNTSDNSKPADSNATQQSSPVLDATAVPDSQETNTTTLPSTDNTTTEAPTTTPSPVPNAEINNIASTLQKNRPNVDSSISPVWMRTAAPLLIVAVLFSATVY
ncbi:uncharacterized protein TM35_000501290 [Trypanosoma theileri]|uniref:Mucin TcMUCII n=1 Tax=Trypanosoma theileri TaxID=67003 RepID=A0A1X0NH91_9TRYP|nr:uncharacterized protein TM35_000501290 [Trypanosoma theileri]ORC84075.1 hypothetical protein TM35_000501290 [Trypanosoma theileri]